MSDSMQYMEREGAFEAGRFLQHKIDRIMLSQIPDPSAARRKEPRLTNDERFIFDEAVSCFRAHGMKRNSVLEVLTQDAFRKNDKRHFEIIAMASDYADEPYQTKHGKNVIAAMQAAAKIMSNENRFPTKLEVRTLVINDLGDTAFTLTEATRWTDVFRDSHLTFLKRGTTK